MTEQLGNFWGGFFKKAYPLHIEYASDNLWYDLEKEAGFRNFMKNTLFGGAMLGSIPAGGYAGGANGMIWGGLPGTIRATSLANSASKVNSAGLVNKWAPKMGYKPGAEGFADHFRAVKASNPELRGKNFMTGSSGMPSYSHLTKRIMAENMAEPSLLAHELGHYNIKSNVSPGLMNTLKGNTLKDETAAWQWAKNNKLSVNPKVENAALSSYKGSTYGARGGAAAGGGAGLLGAAAAARALAANLKKKVVKK